MSVMTLSNLQKTGQFVSSDMFGANAVFSHTNDGVPSSAYAQAASALGVQNIRFGGGQADLDPLKSNAAGEVPIDGQTSINIVEMTDGALRSELVQFLEWCAQQTADGIPTKATLIIPTKHISAQDYASFADEIEAFAATVMQQYGDVIAAFQMGNEYWEMGETSYGIKASLGAEALVRGMQIAGTSDTDQPDILVQMGTAGNQGSEFPATPGVSDFAARNQAANNQIIDQLSDEAKSAIDGVTEHYYYNKTDHTFANLDTEVKNINKDFGIWADRLGSDLDLHITEWNIKTTAIAQHGMVAGSSMVKQFENMIAIGVDGAHVWALDYHSRTALTLTSDQGVRLDAEGRLTNSAQGAVFDLMSGSLVGKELVQTSFANGLPEIAMTAYADAQEIIFYITSRSLEAMTVTLDLATKLPVGAPVTAVQISMDQQSSNGLQWERGVEADSVMLDGELYFYNEHDVDVILTDTEFADASEIALALNPFDVVELTVSLTDIPSKPVTAEPPQAAVVSEKHYYLGDDGDNLFFLTDNVSYIDTGAGIDTVIIDAQRDQATISTDGFGKPVVSIAGTSTNVTLNNVERIDFLDGMLALDTEGNSGLIYRLYQASFDRTPDAGGLKHWIAELDDKISTIEEISGYFLNSAEFTATYGPQNTLDDALYIERLYLNVLDRLPEKAGATFWEGRAADGMAREDLLLAFSESAENKANVGAAIDDGIWYS